MMGATVEAQLSRATSGVGFTYYPGRSAWDGAGATDANRGTCTGSLATGITNTGIYGADCSGFVGKVWQINECAGPMTANRHGPSTDGYRDGTGGGQWAQVDRASIRAGDALVYRTDGRGHIAWVGGGDGWGAMDLYEARSCRYGIVRNTHPAGPEYIAIRRN